MIDVFLKTSIKKTAIRCKPQLNNNLFLPRRVYDP
jgi:hypothetical protein